GSKNLKAISVTGTGGISIADPDALIEARISQIEKYAFDYDNGKFGGRFSAPPKSIPFAASRPGESKRPQSCVGCHAACRARYENGTANEAACTGAAFYAVPANSSDIRYQAIELMNRNGINASEILFLLDYIIDLNKMGIIGPGKQIDCNLDFDDCGSIEFARQFMDLI
ncbi:MAG: hypothetical protein GY761_17855, partial [Hyphomicrobiales bacterium]|nr:hypothetical protein [Hyphomicrobiales bacterium]